MPRARMLKPGFFLNEDLAELPPLVRLLYAGLWTIADREGRLEDRPKRIKSLVLPYDRLDVNAALNELTEAGFLLRYEINGERYVIIPAFRKHQHPHIKEPPSTIPAPGSNGAHTGSPPEKHGADTGLDPAIPERAGRSLDPESVNGVLEKKDQVLSSFSLDPEIARASKTDATATEQAKLVHALNLDRKARRG